MLENTLISPADAVYPLLVEGSVLLSDFADYNYTVTDGVKVIPSTGGPIVVDTVRLTRPNKQSTDKKPLTTCFGGYDPEYAQELMLEDKSELIKDSTLKYATRLQRKDVIGPCCWTDGANLSDYLQGPDVLHDARFKRAMNRLTACLKKASFSFAASTIQSLRMRRANDPYNITSNWGVYSEGLSLEAKVRRTVDYYQLFRDVARTMSEPSIHTLDSWSETFKDKLVMALGLPDKESFDLLFGTRTLTRGQQAKTSSVPGFRFDSSVSLQKVQVVGGPRVRFVAPLCAVFNFSGITWTQYYVQSCNEMFGLKKQHIGKTVDDLSSYAAASAKLRKGKLILPATDKSRFDSTVPLLFKYEFLRTMFEDLAWMDVADYRLQLFTLYNPVVTGFLHADNSTVSVCVSKPFGQVKSGEKGTFSFDNAYMQFMEFFASDIIGYRGTFAYEHSGEAFPFNTCLAQCFSGDDAIALDTAGSTLVEDLTLATDEALGSVSSIDPEPVFLRYYIDPASLGTNRHPIYGSITASRLSNMLLPERPRSEMQRGMAQLFALNDSMRHGFMEHRILAASLTRELGGKLGLTKYWTEAIIALSPDVPRMLSSYYATDDNTMREILGRSGLSLQEIGQMDDDELITLGSLQVTAAALKKYTSRAESALLMTLLNNVT